MIQAKKLLRLTQDLAHPDASKRRSAADALSGGDERAIYPLIRALRDENSGVQDAAMRSLIALGGEVTAYMVLPLLRQDSFLRNTAMIILKEIGVPVVPLLHSLIKDPDPDVRKFALDLICDIKHCDYPEAILRVLERDPNPNVRASAAKAVGILQFGGAVAQLMKALNDDEWVCFSVLEALALLKEASSTEAVSSLLKSPSDALRIAAVETLGRIGTPQALDVLLSHLPGATGFERTATVKSLVQGGVTPPWAEVAEELREMFADGDWNEKQIAVKGFVALQEKRAIVSIIDYAGSLDPSEPETDEKVQVMKDALRSFGCREILAAVFDNLSLKYRGKSIAIEAIGELKCKEAVPYLVGLLEGEVRDVRRASMKALVDIDDGDIRRTLVDAIDDYDGHIRRMAFTALGRIADKASFEPIRKLLPAERYKDVMEEGVKALLSIDSSAVIPCLAEFDVSVREAIARFTEDAATLLALIGDRDFTVRVSAVAGLGRTRDARVCQTLTEAVRDPEAEVRKVAIKAMGELGCCHDVIKSALHDPDMWVRMCAVNALGSSMGQDTLKVLIPMLDDRDIPVVLSAIGAVSRIGGSEVVSILDALTGHPDEGVRKKAHTELEDMKSSGTFG